MVIAKGRVRDIKAAGEMRKHYYGDANTKKKTSIHTAGRAFLRA
jgi:hypothetical protein